jgi:hypothetical protein
VHTSQKRKQQRKAKKVSNIWAAVLFAIAASIIVNGMYSVMHSIDIIFKFNAKNAV